MHTSEPHRPPADGLAALEPDRLAKVCEYLTSAYDGERAAAAHKASAMLGRAGLTWTELVGWAVTFRQQEIARATRTATRTAEWNGYHASDLVRELTKKKHAKALSAWERDFIRSLTRWGAGLRCSQAQWAIVIRLARQAGLVDEEYAA
jgi:hypothetical protein